MSLACSAEHDGPVDRGAAPHAFHSRQQRLDAFVDALLEGELPLTLGVKACEFAVFGRWLQRLQNVLGADHQKPLGLIKDCK
jgi:hypothetical protein